MPRCPTCGALTANGFKAVAPSIVEKPRRALVQMGERTEKGWFVPTVQAGTAGLIAGGIGAVALSLAPGAPWGKAGVLTGLITSGLVWWAAVNDDKKRLWYMLENTLGIDLDGDGEIGEPILQAPDVWVHYPEMENHSARKRFSIPWKDAIEAQKVAIAVLDKGVPFTRRALHQVGALPDHPEHYSGIYQAMRDARLLEGKRRLTDEGKMYLEGCKTLPTP